MALMPFHETPPALGTLRADVTPHIDKVVAKALSKWPEERFQTAGEFSAAFAEVVADADQHALSESSDNKRASASNGGDKQAIAALKPIVQIKPVGQGAFKLRRYVLSAVQFLLRTVQSLMTVKRSRTCNTTRTCEPTAHN